MNALEGPAISRLPAGIAYLSFALVVSAVGWASVNGPQLYAEQERRDAAATAAESEGLCQRLGIEQGTARFETCVSQVSQAMQRHEERQQERFGSLL